jgi:hypothetical protein
MKKFNRRADNSRNTISSDDFKPAAQFEKRFYTYRGGRQVMWKNTSRLEISSDALDTQKILECILNAPSPSPDSISWRDSQLISPYWAIYEAERDGRIIRKNVSGDEISIFFGQKSVANRENIHDNRDLSRRSCIELWLFSLSIDSDEVSLANHSFSIFTLEHQHVWSERRDKVEGTWLDNGERRNT